MIRKLSIRQMKQLGERLLDIATRYDQEETLDVNLDYMMDEIIRNDMVKQNGK